MSDRLLIRGGHVLSMDRDVGELEAADVLIEDGQIAQIAPDIDASSTDVIDATGDVGSRPSRPPRTLLSGPHGTLT